ncbi:hypothetical protein PC116_g22573 [Phytophthora cactorum]|nr:hypothetical protein PC116_g22573 [Phytophthora cactorum]
MRDVDRLRLSNIRESEEVLNDLLKGRERLIARGSIQQFQYEGDLYRSSEGQVEHDRTNRRDRRDYDRRQRYDQDRRETTHHEAWSDNESDDAGADSFKSCCNDGSSSDDNLRMFVTASENERRNAADGTYTRASHRQRRNDKAGRSFNHERRDGGRGSRENDAKATNRAQRVVGQCELYRHLQGFVKYTRSKEDKTDHPPKLRTGTNYPDRSFWSPLFGGMAGATILVDLYGGLTDAKPRFEDRRNAHFMAVKWEAPRKDSPLGTRLPLLR